MVLKIQSPCQQKHHRVTIPSRCPITRSAPSSSHIRHENRTCKTAKDMKHLFSQGSESRTYIQQPNWQMSWKSAQNNAPTLSCLGSSWPRSGGWEPWCYASTVESHGQSDSHASPVGPVAGHCRDWRPEGQSLPAGSLVFNPSLHRDGGKSPKSGQIQKAVLSAKQRCISKKRLDATAHGQGLFHVDLPAFRPAVLEAEHSQLVRARACARFCMLQITFISCVTHYTFLCG